MGSAKASDIRDLILFVHDAVEENYGYDLKIEQEFINWENLDEDNEKKKKIIKIKWVSVLIIFLVVLVLAGGTYLAFQMPIQNIIIKGTTNLSDYEIMSLAGIDNYPSFLKTTGSSIKKKLLENPYITDVSVHKKFLGVLELEITEGYAMYYDSASESLVLSNGNTVKKK